jgi:hypothetical protein
LEYLCFEFVSNFGFRDSNFVAAKGLPCMGGVEPRAGCDSVHGR